MDSNLQKHIEAIIFASDRPVELVEIADVIERSLEVVLTNDEVNEYLDTIREKYAADEYPFELVNISGGFQLMTKAAHHHIIGTFLKLNAKKRLSRVALETLAIIAYKQPVTKTVVESIRGVSSDYAIQKLLEKELVIITGRDEGPGRPLIYETSDKFFEYFGLVDKSDLPKPKDFSQPINEIGEQAPIEEETVVTDSESEE